MTSRITIKSEKLIITRHVKSINKAIKDLNSNKVRISIAIHSIRNTINWRMTEYRFWNSFCTREINLPMSSIHLYLGVGTNIFKLKYTQEECNSILKELSWFRFSKGLSNTDRKISVKGFISKYKTFVFYPSSYRSKENKRDYSSYCFNLPTAQAEKLDKHLVSHGMYINPDTKIRYGLAYAFTKFINKNFK